MGGIDNHSAWVFLNEYLSHPLLMNLKGHSERKSKHNHQVIDAVMNIVNIILSMIMTIIIIIIIIIIITVDIIVTATKHHTKPSIMNQCYRLLPFA